MDNKQMTAMVTQLQKNPEYAQIMAGAISWDAILKLIIMILSAIGPLPFQPAGASQEPAKAETPKK